MQEIVLYGAGNNAKNHIHRWEKMGLKPVCFVDSDPCKQHTTFCGYEVLSLYEAIQKYPGFHFYLTLVKDDLSRVFSYLTSIGIPKDRISACDDTMIQESAEYYSPINAEMAQLINALQDNLSIKLFWGRIQYCFSHTLSSVYLSLICPEYQKWLNNRTMLGVERYGLREIWELIEQNYPVQRNKIYLLLPSPFNQYYCMLINRFVRACEQLNITISAYVVPEAEKKRTDKYQSGLCQISESEFEMGVSTNEVLVIGCPVTSKELPDIIRLYKPYKDRLFLLKDLVKHQYMESFLVPEENEIFVDVGVYDFSNSLDFIAWAKKGFKKVYAFEPDPGCYKRSKKIISSLERDKIEKIELVNKGLSYENSKLLFPADYQSDISEETISVEVVSFDSFHAGNAEERITFVKMDVEGVEMSVLQGMKKTIIKDKPRLAVCVYHRHRDLIDIMTYLKSLVPKYKFYLRHYSSHEQETVLFAII